MRIEGRPRLHWPLAPGTAHGAGPDGLYPLDPSRNIPTDYPDESRIVGYAGNAPMIAGIGGGYLTIEEDSTFAPTTSSINAPPGAVRANGFVALVAGGSAGQSISVYFGSGKPGTAQVVLDVSGYFFLR